MEAIAGDYQVLTFNRSNLTFDKIAGYDVVQYQDLTMTQEVAAPQLPVKIVHMALPPGKDIAGVSIVKLESEYLDGEYNLFPAQPPQILSRTDVQFVQPDQDKYLSSSRYPEKILEISKQGYFSGYNVGALILHPVQYIPSEKTLILHTRIEVEVSYTESDRSVLPFKLTEFSERIQAEALKELVINPLSLARSIPSHSPAHTMLPAEEHLYVIITADNLVQNFQSLADWKRKKGLSANIVTTSWIYSNYAGVDSQEKIRNFIRDAYRTWGTMWVLLGGDNNIIPERAAFAFDCEYGLPSDNWIPCDLYFSDLDGDWNANGNA
jgi:hypothetical protein